MGKVRYLTLPYLRYKVRSTRYQPDRVSNPLTTRLEYTAATLLSSDALWSLTFEVFCLDNGSLEDLVASLEASLRTGRFSFRAHSGVSSITRADRANLSAHTDTQAACCRHSLTG